MAEYTHKSDFTSGSGASEPTKPTENHHAQAPPEFQTTFASLSLHATDRIRLLEFPSEIEGLVRQTVQASWSRGIQVERNYASSYELKLRGNPWSGKGDEAMHSRRLMQQLFANLWNAGWLMSLSTDVSKKVMDKDTLIFRHQLPSPPLCDWISISFSKLDRIRLMDVPIDLREAIINELRHLVQESKPYTAVQGVWELKIVGHPWKASGEATMTSRRIVLKLITVLESFGFTVYASVDQKASHPDSHHSESDTWHCRRAQNWHPGAPVYHI